MTVSGLEDLLKFLLGEAKDISEFSSGTKIFFSTLPVLDAVCKNFVSMQAINSKKAEEFFLKFKENLSFIPSNAILPIVVYAEKRLESHRDINGQYDLKFDAVDSLGAIPEDLAKVANKENFTLFFEYCILSKNYFDIPATELKNVYEKFSNGIQRLQTFQRGREIRFYETLIGIREMPPYNGDWKRMLDDYRAHLIRIEPPGLMTREETIKLRNANPEIKQVRDRIAACLRMKRFESYEGINLNYLLQLKKYLNQ